MKLLVSSSEDNASMNIRARLMERFSWAEAGTFNGHPVLKTDDFMMVQVDKIHLEEDFVDVRFKEALGIEAEVVAFLSRHSAVSGKPALTVHPVGNFASADYGGRPGTLSKSHPAYMTSALRSLRREAGGLDYSVSFETTHHGPILDSPAFFIEIGSTEGDWDREDAANAVAASVMSISDDGYPVIIGVGGGHYAPRFTDLALERKVSVGHMAANYALDALNDDMIVQMSEKSGGPTKVYFHKKGMPKTKYRELRKTYADLGIEEVRSDDFEKL